MKKERLKKVLANLIELIKKQPEKYIFNGPVSEEDIEKVEFVLGIELPHSYREFLKTCNGGFICDDIQLKKRNYVVEGAKWNSLSIFSLEELYWEYMVVNMRKWKLHPSWHGVYPIVPIARTQNNELLVIINPLKNCESPIFDAFHEDPIYDWGILYKSFAEFLESYLREGNNLSQISFSSETAENYMPGEGWKLLPSKESREEDVLRYYEIKLELAPNDYVTICDISRYFLEKKEYNSALFYANKAVSVAPEAAWVYYNRCQVYWKMSNLNMALKDILQAIHFETEKSLYLTVAGELYLELADYEKALEYLTKAAEEDPSDFLPYFMLGKLFRQMGNVELAKKYDNIASKCFEEDDFYSS